MTLWRINLEYLNILHNFFSNIVYIYIYILIYLHLPEVKDTDSDLKKIDQPTLKVIAKLIIIPV